MQLEWFAVSPTDRSSVCDGLCARLHNAGGLTCTHPLKPLCLCLKSLRQVLLLLTFEPGPLYPHHTVSGHQLSWWGDSSTDHYLFWSWLGIKQFWTIGIHIIEQILSSLWWLWLLLLNTSFIGTIMVVVRKLPITSVVGGLGTTHAPQWFTTCHKSGLLLLAVSSARSPLSYVEYATTPLQKSTFCTNFPSTLTSKVKFNPQSSAKST